MQRNEASTASQHTETAIQRGVVEGFADIADDHYVRVRIVCSDASEHRPYRIGDQQMALEVRMLLQIAQTGRGGGLDFVGDDLDSGATKLLCQLLGHLRRGVGQQLQPQTLGTREAQCIGCARQRLPLEQECAVNIEKQAVEAHG